MVDQLIINLSKSKATGIKCKQRFLHSKTYSNFTMLKLIRKYILLSESDIVKFRKPYMSKHGPVEH